MLLEKERQDVVDACLFMQKEKLIVGTAGNVSVRVDDLVAISPSGIPYEEMSAEDVVIYNIDGQKVEGKWKPSTELPLHLSVYRNFDHIGAVTHNHAPISTALGLVVDEVPPSHTYTAMFGGIVRVAPYAKFGTEELARVVTEALDGRLGALMRNHGALTVGPNVKKAVNLLPILEYICEIHLRAMSTGRPIALLTEEEMADALELMKSYGQQPQK